eukprot:12158166-Ditylum_brightwellii.AAC.1
MMNIEENIEDVELVDHDTVKDTEKEEDVQALEDPMTEDLVTLMQSEESLPKTKQKLKTEKKELPTISLQAKLLRWHYRLNHLLFKKIKLLVALGLLPKRLLTVEDPKCTTCILGKMTKQPWCTKGQQSKIHPAHAPGKWRAPH